MRNAAFSACQEWEKESNCCPSRWQKKSHADWDTFWLWNEEHPHILSLQALSSSLHPRRAKTLLPTLDLSVLPAYHGKNYPQISSLLISSFIKEFPANGWSKRTAGNWSFWTKLLVLPLNLAIAWVSQAEDTQVYTRSSHDCGLQPEHLSAVSLPLENVAARFFHLATEMCFGDACSVSFAKNCNKRCTHSSGVYIYTYRYQNEKESNSPNKLQKKPLQNPSVVHYA